MLKNIYLGLKFSFSYFSIFPIKFKSTDDLSKKEVLKYAILFLPFVGFVLSSIIVISHQLFTSSLYISLIFSIIYMILYGFLHTEAIADVMDAIYANHSGKDPYLVIKEPTVGAMGLLYTTSFLILKIASLTYVLYEQLYLEFIVIAIISRLMILYIIKLNEFKSSFVVLLKEDLNISNILIFSLFYSVISYLYIDVVFIELLFLSIVVTYIIINNLYKKLSFLNGDVLGFSLELNELVMMIAYISI